MFVGLFSTSGFAYRNLSYLTNSTQTELVAGTDKIQGFISYRKTAQERNNLQFLSTFQEFICQVKIFSQDLTTLLNSRDKLQVQPIEQIITQYITYFSLPLEYYMTTTLG